MYLHIGAPATGATYLRETLRRHRRALVRYGVLYPSDHVGDRSAHRAAVLDVLGLTDGDPVPTGAWDRLVQAARDWRRGTVVVAHELLADARLARVERVLAGFRGMEVHVVYAARDLARQVPAAWQEWVRSGGAIGFDAYVDQVAARATTHPARTFWRSHDAGAVLERWATFVPAERLHVLTVPSAPDAERVLWQRFAETVGMDPVRLPGADGAEPRPLALAAAEALRRVNAESRTAPSAALLAAAAAVTGPTPALPRQLAGWAHEEADRVLAAVKDGGYDVVGELTELRPAGHGAGGPVVPALEEVLAAQTRILADVIRPGRRSDRGV